MNGTTVFYHPLQLEHDLPGHPETAQRLLAVSRKLPSFVERNGLTVCEDRILIDNDILGLAHEQEYLESLAKQMAYGSGHIDGDTYFTESSFEAARVSLGGLLELGKKVVNGEADNAFALIRPPGHHATRNRAMGFCFYSNVAILAKYLKQEFSGMRSAIVDFDVHHGNGTDDCVLGDEDILFISTHQENIFPNSGTTRLTQNCINLPLIQSINDREYLKVLQNIILPALENFSPEVLILSAGFDAHRNDPLAGLSLSSKCFGEIVRILTGFTQHNDCLGPICALEGGYHIPSLVESIGYSFDALVNPEKEILSEEEIDQHPIRKDQAARLREFAATYESLIQA